MRFRCGSLLGGKVSLRLFDRVAHETTSRMPPSTRWKWNAHRIVPCPMQTPAKSHSLQTGKNPPLCGEAEPFNYEGRTAKSQNNFRPSRWYLEGKTLASKSKDLRSKQGECFCTWHLVWLPVSSLFFLHYIFQFVLYLTALREFVLCNKSPFEGTL